MQNNYESPAKDSYNYIVLVLQDYINTLPQASKIAVQQMAENALKNVLGEVQKVGELGLLLTECRASIDEAKPIDEK